ncbi:SDR family NAD(P)-dependent oxidoreductase [Herbiconiux sp. CPCC 205763]|uniref:SDR family NAD(P)-dependent oxidoreductase n=1 Tax=Herbiconiux aconitum TaxID=2970913 RepID=A0ABT2GMU5_9MICO|nr:SDR family NAD(P)-dependent oxidoreductase [Herbiconiux aconitum]MCS5717562.1 SDR family NAD(P)-dependent oxidoreductase [Herbiconiux aconitum]
MTVTLITGANKGLGRETARRLIEVGHTVYVGARDQTRGAAAAEELGAKFVQIDVTDDESVAAAAQTIRDQAGRLDVLVNNAGIWDGRIGVEGLTGATALAEFDTNAISVVRTIQAFLPLLRSSDNPVVVNVSSGLGSFWAVTNPERGESHYPTISYSASKAAVSMLTVEYAKALPEIKINVADPGFTSSDLTGNTAGQTIAEGAEAIVQLATIGKDGPTGTFHEATGPLAW